MTSADQQITKAAQIKYPELLHAIVSGTSDAVYVKDTTGKYLLFNESAQRITGKSHEEVIGRDDTELFPLEHAQAMMAGDRKVMAARCTETSEDTVVDRHGVTRTFLSTKGPLYDQAGNLTGTFGISRDITERKAIEAQLKESEERYRILVESSPEAILLHRDGSLIFANRAACNLLGAQHPEQLLGLPIFSLVPEEFREQVTLRSAPAESGAGQVNPRVEQQVLRLDGTRVEVEAFGTHLTYQGRPAVQLILSDITARKLAELQQKESDTRYRLLFENSMDAICLTKPDGRIQDANPAACALFGMTRLELCRVHRAQIIDESDPRFAAAYAQRSRDGNVTCELNCRRSDGTLFCAEMSSVIMEPYGAFVILRDITERKKMEDALWENREQLKLFIRYAPAALGMFDSRMCYVSASQRWLDDYGLKGVDLVGRSHYEIFPEIGESWREAHRKGLAGEVLRCEADRFERADGRVQWVRWEIRPWYNSGGEVGGIIIFSEDVSEREALQAELIKVKKLESLGILAGGIAHDFNNILTGILGNLSFARMFLDQEHRSALPLEQAEKAAMRATELTKQLLTFAKGGTPVKKVVAVRPLIEESLALVLSGANVKGVLDIPDSLHAVEVDEGQMGQVFHNLILNALQAMPQGGTLSVSAENAAPAGGEREGVPAQSYVRLSFADQGCGIPEEVLPKIFDPYFTTKARGVGLGLASVYSIVGKHGGWVEVTSRPGCGTVFTLLIPSVTGQPDAPVAEVEPPAVATGAAKPILVMDDEVLILDLTTQVLSHLGYHVTTCTNGEEAIGLYHRAQQLGTPFLAAIMDLTIPGAMGGKEAARRILGNDPGARLIVSSGYCNDPVMAEYQKHGFCAALAKPYKGRDIARVLAALE
jgi:two-component system, cell cycle sensor histidine kinase and response regulator CckA